MSEIRWAWRNITVSRWRRLRLPGAVGFEDDSEARAGRVAEAAQGEAH